MIADRSKRTLAGLVAAVVAVTVILYARTAGYGFVNYDDYHYVINNPTIQDGLSFRSIKWALTTGYFSYWHPITWLVYLTTVSIGGVAAGPMHVVNVLLHAANGGLLLYVLWRMTGRIWPSAVTAAIFAWHPLRVESVAWVSELKDVLSMFFWLLTMLVYVRYAERPDWRRYAVVVGCYILGLASKPMLVVLPPALLLLDFWPLGRTKWLPREDIRPAGIARLALEKVPLLAMALVVAFYAIRVQGQNYALGGYIPLAARLHNALVSVSRYLAKLFWPRDLAVFYPHPALVVDGKIGVGVTIIAAAVFIAITIASIVLWRRKPYLLVGWLWLLGTLLPVSGVVQAGAQAMADRYSYVPLMMITVAAVWLISDWAGPRPKVQKLLAFATPVVLIALLVKSTIQIRYWRDDTALFSHAIAVTEKNYIGYAGIGYVYYQQGRYDDAISQYKIALRSRPSDPLPNSNMGKAYQRQGKLKEAEFFYRRALRTSPPDSDLHNNLANIYAGQGKIDEAIQHHEAAVRIGADLPHTHYNYGVTLFQIGRLKEAQARLERALQLKPDYPDARYTYGLVMGGLGYEVAATGQLREANFLRADWYDALRSLAWLLATSPDAAVRNGAQAIAVAERANQLTGFENPIALDTLAAAYAEAGRFDSAIAAATRAEAAARSNKQADLAHRISQRLALYKAGKPFHRVAGATTQPFNP